MTDLNSLLLSDDEEDIIEINKDTVTEAIFNPELNIYKRIEAIELYQEIYRDDIVSIINRLNVNYLITYTSIIEEYLVEICKSEKIIPELKLDVAKSLTGADNDNNIGFDLIEQILKPKEYNVSTNPPVLSTPCYIDGLVYLMQADEVRYSNSINIYMTNFVHDDYITNEYKLKTLVSINNNYPTYGHTGLFVFMTNVSGVRWKVLAAQVLLQDEYKTKAVYQTLLNVCANEEEDVNDRADAADCLLHLCKDEDVIEQARSCIIALAGRTGHSVYDNGQNVHNIEIEKSVDDIIEKIVKTPLKIQYLDAKKDIEKVTEEFQYNKEYVVVALQRIELDQKIYGKFNIKLNNLFLLVWNYIHVYCKDNLIELKKRMVEELVDMANTCSSGHSSRLVNVLSGFTDLQISISYEDQIIGNLQARLFTILKNTKKLTNTEKEEVMVEFTLDSDYKPNFNQFFRQHYGCIKEEMWKEFCIEQELMTDEEFDNIMGKAVIKFTYG